MPNVAPEHEHDVRLLRPEEVAEALRVSVRTVYNIVRRGDLTACRIGLGDGRIRVHPDDLAAYVKRLRNRLPR